MFALPKMTRFISTELELSLDIPQDWKPGQTQTFQLVLLAPEEGNYQANIGFNYKTLEPPTLPALYNLYQETSRQQAQKYQKYRQTRLEEISIEGNKGYLRTFEWETTDGAHYFSQIQAGILIAADQPTILSISASSLKQFEAKYIPLLENAIRSLKFGL